MVVAVDVAGSTGTCGSCEELLELVTSQPGRFSDNVRLARQAYDDLIRAIDKALTHEGTTTVGHLAGSLLGVVTTLGDKACSLLRAILLRAVNARKKDRVLLERGVDWRSEGRDAFTLHIA